jgi:predicted acetyltransferase
MTELVVPSEQYRASYLAAQAERSAAGEEADVTADTFAALLAKISSYAAGRVKPGRVAETTLWLVEGDEYIGRISLRHTLNPVLHAYGGHVGYDVRPSRRRQGHATRMLALAIPHLAALGIDPALITCDEDNIASRKVIEACGGQLATDDVDVAAAVAYATASNNAEALAELAEPRCRYWLPTH